VPARLKGLGFGWEDGWVWISCACGCSAVRYFTIKRGNHVIYNCSASPPLPSPQALQSLGLPATPINLRSYAQPYPYSSSPGPYSAHLQTGHAEGADAGAVSADVNFFALMHHRIRILVRQRLQPLVLARASSCAQLRATRGV
jgi:hypothetical protein